MRPMIWIRRNVLRSGGLQGAKRLSSFALGEEHIKWTPYISPTSKTIFNIAEAADIDAVFEEAINNDLPEPFGIVTWDSSFIAADILDKTYAHHKASLVGCTVCDLGCGTGLTSLVCYSYGAKVLALDFNEVSLKLGRKSLEKYMMEHPPHSVTSSIQFIAFDIEKDMPLPRCDLLILSDITYYDVLAVSAARRVYEAVSQYGSKVLITDPGRPAAQVLLSELSRLFLNSNNMQQLLYFQPHTVEGVTKGYYCWL